MLVMSYKLSITIKSISNENETISVINSSDAADLLLQGQAMPSGA